ncbi:MAG TPA: hypothetical protein VNT32_10875 [Thermoleophilaceae bacterium]|nr:hypothetical protein [Thermoleophilaceae bacterium]
MRRHLAILLVVVAALAVAETAFAQTGYRWALPEWRQTWSGGPLADDRGFVVRAAPDAVYVAGVSGSGDGGGDLLLQRYALDGTLVWSKEWGGAELDQAQGMVLTNDGIFVVGSESSTGDGINQSLIVRFSYSGDVLASKIWNVGVTSTAQAVTERAGALYVAGLAHPTPGNRDLYLAKIDPATLERTWTRRWGGPLWDEAWDVQADASRIYVSGYTTNALTSKTDNLLLLIDPATGAITKKTVWGGPGNDEARAMALEGGTLWVAGGGQRGTSGDAFLAKLSTTGSVEWTRYAFGAASGAYGLAVGEDGIYVAGGSYDFPAGGDAAILRFNREGEVEWSQIFGQPGFWDWGFDVDARDGRFYVTGTLYTPGQEWYEILTVAYDEDFETASLDETVTGTAAGDPAAAAALDHFWIGDLIRYARGPKAAGESGPATESGDAWTDEDPDGETPPSGSGAARVQWIGASDFGREQGSVWVDSSREVPVGEDNAVAAFSGLSRDLPGNPALVRDYTGVRGSVLDGLVRFRYFISHDRLIPQGGYITVNGVTVPLPPPPV